MRIRKFTKMLILASSHPHRGAPRRGEHTGWRVGSEEASAGSCRTGRRGEHGRRVVTARAGDWEGGKGVVWWTCQRNGTALWPRRAWPVERLRWRSSRAVRSWADRHENEAEGEEPPATLARSRRPVAAITQSCRPRWLSMRWRRSWPVLQEKISARAFSGSSSRLACKSRAPPLFASCRPSAAAIAIAIAAAAACNNKQTRLAFGFRSMMMTAAALCTRLVSPCIRTARPLVLSLLWRACMWICMCL